MNAIFLLVTMRSWLLGLIVSARVRASAFARVVAACAIRHTNAPGLGIVQCEVLCTNARRRNTAPLYQHFSSAVCLPTSSLRPLLALMTRPVARCALAASVPVIVRFGAHTADCPPTALCMILAPASLGFEVSTVGDPVHGDPSPLSSSPRPCVINTDFGNEERAVDSISSVPPRSLGAAPGNEGPRNECFATGFS